jgi:hypothetical protein
VSLIRAIVLLIGLLAAGCATTPLEPDLVRLYRPVAQLPKAHPLIVIPGIMGSRLVRADTGLEVWPGPLSGLVAGRDWSDLALPVPGAEDLLEALRPAPLVAGGIFNEIAGADFYGQIIRTLTEAGGYTCVPRDQIAATTNCVLFAWDWRKGMVTASAELDETVERLRSLHGDPTLKVDIVAHSAGGLLARYFVRYGGVDVLDTPDAPITFAGGLKVRQAVLIGTPNYGSITMLQRAITGDRIGMSHLRPETIATMPGMFQLLPHPDRTWMLDTHGKRVNVDLYDIATWRRYRWSAWDPKARERLERRFGDPSAAAVYLAALENEFQHQLIRAARFHRAVSRPVRETPTSYIVFGSACVPTAAHCVLEDDEGQASIALLPRDIRHPVPGIPYDELMIEPGDGAVTKASLLARDSLRIDAPGGDFPIAWTVFICEHHDQLAGNATFRDNLLNIVLYGVKEARATASVDKPR